MNYLDYLVEVYKKLTNNNTIFAYIELRTMANPGWGLEIKLESTFLEKKIFNEVVIEITEDNWIHSRLEKGSFCAWGGLFNIKEMCLMFLRWAEDCENINVLLDEKTSLDFLSEWYLSHCDGSWEHFFSCVIWTVENGDWRLRVALGATELEFKHFESIRITRSDNDWFSCEVKDSQFLGFGGPSNLPELLGCFQGWVTQLYKQGVKAYTWHDTVE